ncbi:MAG: alkaline phosphatase PhoX, partial [Cyanobacteria bacterium J06635_13]
MSVNRRNFLYFLGATAGSLTAGFRSSNTKVQSLTTARNIASASIKQASSLNFQPVRVPLPLDVEQLSIAQQLAKYATYEVQDDLVLPAGYTYNVIAAWGDAVGDSRFGYNNDYLSFIETAPGEGFLTVNFEYISGKTWMQTYPLVIGTELPFAELLALAEPMGGDQDQQK